MLRGRRGGGRGAREDATSFSVPLMRVKIPWAGEFAVLGVEHGCHLLQRISRAGVLLDEVNLIVVGGITLLAEVQDVILHRQGFRLGDRPGD